MAFDDLEIKRNENALAQFLARRRPPPHIRDQLDIACKISGQSVEIVEVRADWKDPTRKIESPVAKATFVRAKNHWNVYWRRSDLKWHGYEPNREVKTLESFLDVVDRDKHGCFFG